MSPPQRKSSGTLLHISALPSRFGIGDLGPSAYRFVDILAEAGHSHWQVLPLNPTSAECGNSPYTSESGFAGNLLFVSPEKLAQEGLIEGGVSQYAVPEGGLIDYASVARSKASLLRRAYSAFRGREDDYVGDYGAFDQANSAWLDEYALYKTLCESFGQPWYSWPEHLRRRDGASLKPFRESEKIRFHKFCQFVFFRQWADLKKYCLSKGIGLIGDLPYYLSHDSADVWANQGSFKLGEDHRPTAVSGVPPDYFSSNGQMWGHPVYEWGQVREDRFALWMDRIGHSLRLFDTLRIDHFRGLLAYWEIPAGEATAVRGSWVKVPSDAFFHALSSRFPAMPFIAEDLGVITEDVRHAIERLGLPGMRVLIFGFDGDPNNPHLPHNIAENSVAYTGTHDTNTVRGWYVEEADEGVRKNLSALTGSPVSEADASWTLMRLASGSGARLCIFPVQDILSLGPQSRLNRPSVAKGNYLWKLTEPQLDSIPAQALRQMATVTGRL